MNEAHLFDRIRLWLRESIGLKLCTVGFLALVLLIPAAMIEFLIRERAGRRAEAIAEIGSKWGYAQSLSGPVLHVPYRRFWKDEKGETLSVVEIASFLPSTLEIRGSIGTHVRYRGIYEALLYTAELKVFGEFKTPQFDRWGIAPEHVLWDGAYLAIGMTDPRGIQQRVDLQWGAQTLELQPGTAGSPIVRSGISSFVPLGGGKAGSDYAFSFPLSLRGSEQLEFTPSARTTTIALESAWAHPSFIGGFLPREREISPDGFSAEWTVLDINRQFPQQWLGSEYSLNGSEFGVRFLYPVDSYQKAERAQKYAVLVIGITFLSLFFVEILRHERVHALNYLLIGSAVCMFYVLLLSLSEHLGFDRSYWAAALATTGLISWHARNILSDTRLSRTVGGLLLVFYAFVFVLLQLQDFALLIGSLGLFVTLGAVMAAAGRVRWARQVARGAALQS